jgi:hypothetical protein
LSLEKHDYNLEKNVKQGREIYLHENLFIFTWKMKSFNLVKCEEDVTKGCHEVVK